jgi:hypothetical protein
VRWDVANRNTLQVANISSPSEQRALFCYVCRLTFTFLFFVCSFVRSFVRLSRSIFDSRVCAVALENDAILVQRSLERIQHGTQTLSRSVVVLFLRLIESSFIACVCVCVCVLFEQRKGIGLVYPMYYEYPQCSEAYLVN